jgi:hypothetical protein
MCCTRIMCELSEECQLVGRREGGEGYEREDGRNNLDRKRMNLDGWMGVHG